MCENEGENQENKDARNVAISAKLIINQVRTIYCYEHNHHGLRTTCFTTRYVRAEYSVQYDQYDFSFLARFQVPWRVALCCHPTKTAACHC
jgi:hypothetical protein